MSLADDVLAGNSRAAARLMRDLDDRIPGATATLKELFGSTGRARIIGITGNPGCGKSTLVDALIRQYRQRDQRVGVVAVDPSSPFSGGAILGDRIRMQRHALDEGVFIRSVASRGHLGGLSRSTNDIVLVLDAMGFDVVFIETVGVGQAEVDIVDAAHVSVVLVVPGLGDEVQALKAGVLEIADILCVNKADREGADRTLQELEMMLSLRPDGAPRTPVLSTSAVTGQGVSELAAELDRQLGRHDPLRWEARQLARARRQVADLLQEQLARRVVAKLGPQLEQQLEEVARRQRDPYTLVEQIVSGLLGDARGLI